MAVDKPVVQFSLSKLRKEVTKAEVLQMSLSNSKTMTWPDIKAMDSVEAEVLFDRINADPTNWKFLSKWLSPEDVEALKAEKLTLGELEHVVSMATKYYQDFYGTPGERAASAS
jgi:hypothetical protein